MGNSNSKLNSRKVEPTMTITGNHEVPVKNVLNPINSLKKILNEKKSLQKLLLPLSLCLICYQLGLR